MKESLHLKLEKLLERQEELEGLLSDPEIISNQNKFRVLSQEYAEIRPIMICFNQYLKITKNIENSHDMLKEDDNEIRDLAEEELKKAEGESRKLENELQVLLLPKDPSDNNNIFLEIRAGTGGEEAALFSGDLMRMYSRYAETRNWEVEYISVSESDLEGYKEVIMRVIGNGAYSRLKFESGAHRVQRVPETESQGRIHTSACTVAVLPEVEEINEVQINTADLRIDTFRASGAGGQHVNKTDSAIRITHLPTNTVVECQDERSQHKNKARAMSLLQARLLNTEREQQQNEQAENRRSLVGSGDRSERIRTYNFPQNRITDHRIKQSWHTIEATLAGDLGPIVAVLQAIAAGDNTPTELE